MSKKYFVHARDICDVNLQVYRLIFFILKTVRSAPISDEAALKQKVTYDTHCDTIEEIIHSGQLKDIFIDYNFFNK